jgi:hypothetical protein
MKYSCRNCYDSTWREADRGVLLRSEKINLERFARGAAKDCKAESQA